MRCFYLIFLLACGSDVSVGKVGVDADQDGYDASVDCDDGRKDVSPTAEERCDGLDNNCDGAVDEGAVDAELWYPDADGDGHGLESGAEQRCAGGEGWSEVAGDCDDGDATVHPGAEELDCRDPVDRDCDGEAAAEDADGDGSWACDDCDDADAEAHPGAEERCGGGDDDCDGWTDEEDPDLVDGLSVYADLDGDGFGAGEAVLACAVEAGWALADGDCGEEDPSVSPGAVELCSGEDEDCDDLVDEADPDLEGGLEQYPDGDGDGWGAGAPRVACELEPGMAELEGDCDDSRSGVHPGAEELCSGEDEDCDALVDEEDADLRDAAEWWADGDGDGWGSAGPALACSAPAGHVSRSGDCDDGDLSVHPGAVEACGGLDEDCDGLVDDADSGVAGALDWYADGDGDGVGAGAALLACEAPVGYVGSVGDCDDTQADVGPGSLERCAEGDEDCDGLREEADPDLVDASEWYTDGDGDGWGAGEPLRACSAPAGAVAREGDCDDGRAERSPEAEERCGGGDEDCDLLEDEADPDLVDALPWYVDGDGDGHGAGAPIWACAAPAGRAGAEGDCEDADARVFPGAEERCADGLDADCDGLDGSCREGLYVQSSAEGAWDEAFSGGYLGRGGLSSAGDMDGDGVEELAIGDEVATTSLSRAGAAWIIYGGPEVENGGLGQLSDEPSIFGVLTNEALGEALCPAGDMDLDGYDDLLIGSDKGAYLLWGDEARLEPGQTRSTGRGVLFEDSTTNTYEGAFLPPRPIDLDDDGLQDLLIPDWLGGSSLRSKVHIYYGDGSRPYASVSLTSSPTIYEVSSPLGYQGAIDAADLNGDGLAELLVGYPNRVGSTWYDGRVYLFLGDGARFTGATASSSADCTWTGGSSDRLGTGLIAAPDMDGDGYAELVMSAPYEDDGGTDTGTVYVYGGGAVCSGTMSTSSADLRIVGDDPDGNLGSELKSGGDMNGDGQGELIVSDSGWDPQPTYERGAIFVYSLSSLGGTLRTSDADFGLVRGDLGGLFYRPAAGDFNGDGAEDLIAVRSGLSPEVDGLLFFRGGSL